MCHFCAARCKYKGILLSYLIVRTKICERIAGRDFPPFVKRVIFTYFYVALCAWLLIVVSVFFSPGLFRNFTCPRFGELFFTMIGPYLNSLYSHCPSLRKTPEYDETAVTTFFEGEVAMLLKKHNIQDEHALLLMLTTTKYRDLEPFFQDFPILELFYLVNSLGEYQVSTEQLDVLGRLKFESSVQMHTGITENRVWKLMADSIRMHTVLGRSFQITHQKSSFFLSHDIDSLYGSLLQDGAWALKSGRLDVLLRLFIQVLSAKPHWFNIDLVMKLESEYDFKSTFYWLVNKGRVDARQTNADYTIQSKKVKQALDRVVGNGFENGLHKSISPSSFGSELVKLPVAVHGNRYHYLKFQLPAAYSQLTQSGLKLDASLGFAEHYGFRNNYGYPFMPYDVSAKKQHTFLEVPLNIMDGTFQRYLKVQVEKTAETVIGFLEKHRQDCLLSILWHNTFFTDYKYKGYRQEYIKILQFLYEEKFTNINQSGIIELFAWRK